MINGQPRRFFEFGPFRIDTRERMLLRNGMPLPVTPKVFDILLALVENRGHTVGKDELIDRIWPDAFVEVGNLNRNISTLRGVLGEDSHEPRFIKTFPKLGYRFDADVREVIEDEAAPVIEKRSVNHKGWSIFGRRKIAVLFAAAVGIGILLLGWAYTNRNGNQLQSGDADGPHLANGKHEAFELYQKGRRLWQDRSGESLHQATLLLERAVTVEPTFALAYAALADAYAFDLSNRAKAEETARKAIELDPSLGEPYATIGFIRMFWEWKLPEAEIHFRQAVTLSPNYSTGHQWYSINLMAIGQGNAALAEIKKALELAPGSLPVNADLCQVLYFTRRLDEAEMQCRKTLNMDPKFLNANLLMYEIYMGKGMHDEAVAQFFRNEELAPNYAAFPGLVAELKSEYNAGGIRAFWRKRIAMLKKLPASEYSIALYHARLGDNEQVFKFLKEAHEKHDLNFLNFLAEPLFFGCCYPDSRYEQLQKLMIGR